MLNHSHSADGFESMIHLWATSLLRYDSSAVTTRELAHSASECTIAREALIASLTTHTRYALSASDAGERYPAAIASPDRNMARSV